jgi:1,2-dihydroxy-3-keto-5-methylthiopentene dioxygenase
VFLLFLALFAFCPGYFDIRARDGRWVRIQTLAGDVIELPAGAYHRFCPDRADHVKAIRLFKGEPVWTPIAKDEAHPVRAAYVQQYLAAG